MLIRTDFHSYDIPVAMAWVTGTFGGALLKRVEGFEQIERRSPFLKQYYNDTFQIEFDLAEAIRHRRKTGRYTFEPRFHRAYSLASALQRMSSKLSREAEKRLKRRLEGAMKDSFGLRPIAYEVDNAVHLIRKGFDVEWVAMTETDRFDLLGTKNGRSIEIECKTTSPDTGRKVHRAAIHKLADRIADLLKIMVSVNGVHLYRITVPNRLDTNEFQIAELANLITAAWNEKSDIRWEQGRIEQIDRDLRLPPLRSEDEIREFLTARLGTVDYNALWRERPGHAVAGIIVVSEKTNSVRASILDEAKRAASQCTGKRPAVVALQLIEMGRTELEVLL